LSGLHYPKPLARGDRIAIIAPSSGVESPLHARLDLVLAHLAAQGFSLEEGASLRQEHLNASAPAEQRAIALQHTLMRDDVHAILPPWGGELAIELLDRLDWQALTSAKPKWCIGYSDTSTWLLPLTLRLGWATAHGPCLMDLAPTQTDLLTTQALAQLSTPIGGSFTQRQSPAWQKHWTDFAKVPSVPYALTETTRWHALHEEPQITMRGRLIGGCIDTLQHLAGSLHGDVPRFIQQHASDGVVLYLENAGQSPTAMVRALQQLRWAGWMSNLAGVLLGRSAGPDAKSTDDLGYRQAVQQTLGTLPCPVLLDVDIGHLPPQLMLVNGALADLQWTAQVGGVIHQTLR
jgi:muramoyltetrapeptide carboxypeptidase